MEKKNYRRTLTACYLGFITQAITANFAPLLFLKFHMDYQIPLGRIALIPTAFFLTQLLIDVFAPGSRTPSDTGAAWWPRRSPAAWAWPAWPCCRTCFPIHSSAS